MPRVLMNFQRNKDWIVHFIEADCKTTIGRRDRFFHFPVEEDFRAFVSRCNLEDREEFRPGCDRGRAAATTNLSEEQYAKLKGVLSHGEAPHRLKRPQAKGKNEGKLIRLDRRTPRNRRKLNTIEST